MYYNARYYDPDLARYLQADPMLDGMNRYSYCGNNPIRYNDPTGFWKHYADAQAYYAGYEITRNSSGDYGSTVPTEEAKAQNELLGYQQELNNLRSRQDTMGLWDTAIKEYRVKGLEDKIKSGLERYLRAGFDTDFVRENTSILIQTGINGERGKDLWDGSLSVEFMGVSLGSVRVQTWADSSKGGVTLPLGSYTGQLYESSLSYLNAIHISGVNVRKADNILIHPNMVTNPIKYIQNIKDGINNGPWQVGSQGCIIMSVTSMRSLTRGLRILGFNYDNTNFHTCPK